MGKKIIAFVVLCLFCTFSFHDIHAQQAEDIALQTYIVHVSLPGDRILSGPDERMTYHESFLPEAFVSSDGPTPRLLYSYNHVASGFAAKLTPAHVKLMEKKEGFISARPQNILTLHTTHTPKFLGFHQNLGIWNESNYGEGVIVGILDTGITPNHPSFHDKGVPPPPKKWKGKCDFGKMLCNNKIIGVRDFLSSLPEPPLDFLGHGTHTSSTAVGNFVKGANLLGQANGTAVGIAPLAHVAMYRVCWVLGCSEAAILAGMDTAIDDGVDVLSLSIGGKPIPFYSNGIAIGAYAAIRKGIFVSCSAGNSGPSNATISNGAPWILTVGASTIDRNIRSTVVLGNGEQYNGETIFQPNDFLPTPLPLVYPVLKDRTTIFCAPGSLFNTDVKGKVVLCDVSSGFPVVDQGEEVKNNGGAGMILLNDVANAYTIITDTHVLPVVHVSYADGLKIKEYINSTISPTTKILFKGTFIGDKTAPVVASFSSRGPNIPSLGILKPDIIGPGVNILAAWPEFADNKTEMPFNIISGTSMSCPHLSGIAALIKKVHPDWSPAAIKSALMTTSDIKNLDNKLILDEKLQPADLFAVGAGHVNPVKASDPGLIYDIKPDDYIPYLCGLYHDDIQVNKITRTKVKCSEVTAIPEAGLNYPSFSIALGKTSLTYTRIVTNVGPAKSFYVSSISNPPGVEVTVKPKTLEFFEENEKLTYEVTFSRSSTPLNEIYVQGYLAWSSNTSVHYALSPISVQLI